MHSSFSTKCELAQESDDANQQEMRKFLLAATDGDIECVRGMIESATNNGNLTSQEWIGGLGVVLCWAAKGGRTEVVEYILEHHNQHAIALEPAIRIAIADGHTPHALKDY